MNLFKLYIVSVILLLLCTQASDGGIVLALLIKLIALKGALFLGTPIALGSFLIGQGVGFFAGKLVGGYAILKTAQKYHEREKAKWKGSNVVYTYKGWGKGKSKGVKHTKGYHNGYSVGSVISDAINKYKNYKVKYGSGWKSAPVHSSGYPSSIYSSHNGYDYLSDGYKPGPPPSSIYDSDGYKSGPPPSSIYDSDGYKSGPPSSSTYDSDGYKPGPPPSSFYDTEDVYIDHGHERESSYSNLEAVTKEPPSFMDKIISKIPLSSLFVGSKGDEEKSTSFGSLQGNSAEKLKYKVPSNFPYKNTHLPGQHYKPPTQTSASSQKGAPGSIQAIIGTPNYIRSPEDTDFSYFPKQTNQHVQNNNFGDSAHLHEQNKDIYKYDHPDDPGHFYGYYPGSSQIYDGPGKKYTGVLTDIYDDMKKNINPHGYGIPMGKPMGLDDNFDGPGIINQNEYPGMHPNYEGPGKEFTGMITNMYDEIQKTKEKEFEIPLGKPMGMEDYPDENKPYDDHFSHNKYSKRDKSKRRTSKPNYLIEKYLENKLEAEAAKARDANHKKEAKKLIDLLRKTYISQLKASIQDIDGSKEMPQFVPFPNIPNSPSTSTQSTPTSTAADLFMSSTEPSASVVPSPTAFRLAISNIMNKLTTVTPSAEEAEKEKSKANHDSGEEEELEYELEYEYDSGERSDEHVKPSSAKQARSLTINRQKREGESQAQEKPSTNAGINISSDQAQQLEMLYTFMEEIKQFFTLVSVLDQDTCLQKMVCDVHGKLASGQDISTLSTYESNMVTTFRIMDTIMPLNKLSNEDSSTKYRIAAKIGEATKSDICQSYYSSCAYTTSQIISLGNQVEATSEASTEVQDNYSGNPNQRQDSQTQSEIRMPKV